MTNKTFQDILIEQLEAAAELGNADAMYQLFLNEKMCPEDPSKADEDRAEEYLKYAYENNLEPWTAMQIMRYSRWGYDGEINAKARESGDLRPGAKPPDWHEWSGIPDPSNPSRPQTKGSMGSMNSFRNGPVEEPPRLIEDEDSQTTWLEDDGSGTLSFRRDDRELTLLFLHTRPLVAVLLRRNTTGGLGQLIERQLELLHSFIAVRRGFPSRGYYRSIVGRGCGRVRLRQ